MHEKEFFTTDFGQMAADEKRHFCSADPAQRGTEQKVSSLQDSFDSIKYKIK
jgi:hypothetical protein